MNPMKKIMASAGTALAAGLLAASVAAPAAAAPATSTIRLCTQYNLGGQCTYEYSPVPNMTYASEGNFQDQISSIANYSGSTWCFWTDNNYQGIQGVFQNNYTWNTLSYPYNDSISSGKPC
ncbi:hypothetical protein IAG44_42790 [Streptomyces roseirectus]|uniref:Peptidase inhibitor family I36 n=1 Tax=Streptomyces roseirectus TaxID=2768066 RepID=A0A7H0IRQ9_9ACTN|nr:hypothetical protein [Streptomyces roseirectus]QNP75475.1 hypothetical protein IAG44_42790 [Streptomyces roseirectus]